MCSATDTLFMEIFENQIQSNDRVPELPELYDVDTVLDDL